MYKLDKGFYLGASFNFNLHINTEHFGETLEGTGQAEDRGPSKASWGRLKLSPKKGPNTKKLVYPVSTSKAGWA